MAEENEKRGYIYSISVAIFFTTLIWLVFVLHFFLPIDLVQYGIRPRYLPGLAGIVLSPFIHVDLMHIISNTLAFFALTLGLFFFYPTLAWRVFALVTLGTGLFTWAVGPPNTYHIGISGLIYGFAAFLFLSGLLRRDIRLMALSVIVYFLYGGMIWGILPIDPQVSWEAHLGGLLTGAACAYIFRRYGPQRRKYDWEHEADDRHEHRPHGIGDYIEIKREDDE